MAMLQVAFDAATDAMLVVDQDRRVHWANQAAANLLPRGLPIAVTNRELKELFTIAPDDRQLHLSGLLIAKPVCPIWLGKRSVCFSLPMDDARPPRDCGGNVLSWSSLPFC